MIHQITTHKKLDTGIHNRRCVSWNELNSPMSTAWGESEAELEKNMNGSVKHANTPRSTLWDELEVEIERRMSGWLKELNEPGSIIPTDEREKPLSSKKGESQSSFMEAPKNKCEPLVRSHVANQGQQTCQKTVVSSDVKTPNSEKGPPLDKKRNKLPMGGLLWEKLWMKRLKKPDSKSTLSTSSSTEIDMSKSFDSKSCSTKRVWPFRSLNFIKSTNTVKKGISLPTEIGTSSEKRRMPSMERDTNHSHPSEEESWLQQTIRKRDQTWLKQAKIAIEEAKKNAKSSEPFDKCSSSVTSGSKTSEGSGTYSDSDSESDCSDDEYTYPRTDARATSYTAHDVVMDSDGLDIFFSWLTCTEIMVETELDMDM